MSENIIKLFLIEDNPGDARLMKELLLEISTVKFEVTHAGNLTDALNQVSKNNFDIIISDLTLPDSSGIDTFLKLHSIAHNIPIIMLTGFDDDELVTRIMQEGAQDYLVKGQVTSSSLLRSIKFSIERQKTKNTKPKSKISNGKKGKVLGFIGAKGGVGTTTVTLNTAMVLAQSNKNVIVVELMSYHGSFSQLLGQTPSSHLGKLLEIEPKSISENELEPLLVNYSQGIRILFSPQEASEYKDLTPEHVTGIINGLRNISDVVILDLSNYPSCANKVAALECDFISLVVDNEPISFASAKQALELLKLWGCNRGNIASILVNRIVQTQPMKISDMKLQLGSEIIGIIPSATLACTMAQKSGEPIVKSQLDNNFVDSIIQIANKLGNEQAVTMKI